jgi:hypothetical protein
VGTSTKEDESVTGHIWAAGFHHVTARSHLARVLKLTNDFFNFQIFFEAAVNRGYWIRGYGGLPVHSMLTSSLSVITIQHRTNTF